MKLLASPNWTSTSSLLVRYTSIFGHVATLHLLVSFSLICHGFLLFPESLLPLYLPPASDSTSATSLYPFAAHTSHIYTYLRACCTLSGIARQYLFSSILEQATNCSHNESSPTLYKAYEKLADIILSLGSQSVVKSSAEPAHSTTILWLLRIAGQHHLLSLCTLLTQVIPFFSSILQPSSDFIADIDCTRNTLLRFSSPTFPTETAVQALSKLEQSIDPISSRKKRHGIKQRGASSIPMEMEILLTHILVSISCES